MTYRTLPPAPGGRRERRLRNRARLRTYRQLGTTVVMGAVAAATFTSAGATNVADAWRDRNDGPVEVPVAAVSAGDVEVEVETVTTENAIANNVIQQSDPGAMAGTQRVVQAGAPGVELVSYTVTTINGVEVDRFPSISVVVTPPTDEIVAVGALTIPPATDVQRGTNRALGQQLAADLYGWTGDQWQCLDELWKRESGWSHTAENRNSGAYGIPQALPGSKMATFGSDWQTNPATQIKWGLSYVSGRYSTPCGAWGHFTSKNWY
ncbi:G5 domain-containing protein [Demequina sp. TTPB684]|uniref:G5 domain-containing protein n=1 Tax=unclassified Demequina TaxID=2620311 RepID=UPI001CF28FF8|nr:MULTISPECIES: G5 domain-containing protein [unclassified Demequina]MCB2413366.1 G5 domain-containing protein [Demequina sp. TTPB684]UPU87379.1 G5 domain-containing protein [Demequina sp. TMPB413]